MFEDVRNKIMKIVNSHPLVMYKIETEYLDPPTYNNDELYNLAKELEEITYPTREDDYVRVYYFFFSPVKLKEVIKLVPISLVYLKKFDAYELFINTRGKIRIGKGNKEADEMVKNLLLRVLEFSKFQINRGIFITVEDIDKHYLEGKVRLKYVRDPVITLEEAKDILRRYKENLNKRLDKEISLRDYLETVKVIYEALGLDTKGHIKDLYSRYADGRDCGMMNLPLDNPPAFRKWLNQDSSCGGHPFEVVKGGLFTYGILLYPPEEGRYVLSPGDYYEEYYKVVKEFLAREIPFKSPGLVDALKILTGLKEVIVNGINSCPKMLILYDDVKNKRRIKWEEIKEVEYRREKFRIKNSNTL
ncbi:hypothetical protein [Acidianus sp. HS-5]|uniref:hypothetical protein n=1 Tax=Acidianus sp. HS-5 TaxID=2886040 RepID=UPI001F2133A6|nr:hypothetical protein [Acidianus sp. HS-5]BDC17923.1 hypothetical protein HS5_08130 [Acidianus sp. HS-5]